MTLTFSQYDSYKLITEFNEDDCYTHRIPSGEEVRVEEWKRLKQIGKGAFGSVWKEKCTQNGAVRAVKQIHKSHTNIEELHALVKMSHYSKYFVRFFGWFRDEENIYLAMEYIECGDLEVLIEEEDLSEDDTKSVTRQLLDGLVVMHEHNFCHRDLKPQNVLIVRWIPLMVKISDFGIAKQIGNKTELQTFAGSPGYMAPEIWGYLDAEYTNAVDIWSLGCLLHMMITKETPFQMTRELLDYIQGKIAFPETKIKDKLSMATEFITGLMMPLPRDRLTAVQARGHPWLGIQSERDITLWGELPASTVPRNVMNSTTIAAPTATLPGTSKSKPDIITPKAMTELGPETKKIPSTLEMIVQEPEMKHDPTIQREIANILVMAASNGHREIVQLMLDQGGDVITRNNNGYTLLNIAAAGGYIEVVELLLEKGASIMERGGDGHTSLHLAAQNGHMELVQLMLRRGADPTARTSNGYTPLHQATSNGHMEVFQLLLEKGADITAKTYQGYTLLHMAAEGGGLEVVQFLLEAGADILEKSDVMEYTALFVAAQNGHKLVVQFLVEKGADTMAANTEGYTPSHQAAQNGHMDILLYLLEKGADIMARTRDGYTLLHVAASRGQMVVAEFLLKEGVGIMARSEVGHTSLHLAAQEGRVEVTQLLLEQGADIMARTTSGYTPLHQAASNGHIEVIKILHEEGADINAKTEEGHTPLHAAVSSGNIEETQFLLEKGADIMECNEIGYTPMHIAAQNGYTELVSLLLESGTDINATTVKGFTPLQIATTKGHTDIVRLLLEWATKMPRDTHHSVRLNLPALLGRTEPKKQSNDTAALPLEDTKAAVLSNPVGEGRLIVEEEPVVIAKPIIGEEDVVMGLPSEIAGPQNLSPVKKGGRKSLRKAMKGVKQCAIS